MAKPLVRMIQKEFFFDRANVQDRIDKGKHRHLNWLGGYTCQTIIRSMRKAPQAKTKTGRNKNLTRHGRYTTIQSGKRKGQQRFQKGLYSPPGKPPFYRENVDKNLRSIVYEYDPKDDSVIWVTQKTNGSNYVKPRVPILMEQQGKPGTTMTATFSNRIRGPRRRQYPSRPFMRPGGEKGVDKFNQRIKAKGLV